MCNKCIDTHAHLWNDSYLLKLKECGSPDTDIAMRMNNGSSKEDLESRIKDMNNAGVKFQVLSVTPQSPQWGTSEQALELAIEVNNLYHEVAKMHPGRFIAYAAVPLPHVQEAIQEARRCILEMGFKGVAINTLIQNKYSIADEQFAPFLEELDKLGAILYIHPTGCGANSDMINDHHLEWVIGAPVEDIIVPLQLLKADIPNKYPNIKFHIAHLGGGLPFLMQRVEDNYTDWHAFTSSPTQMLKERFWFDTANFHEPSLICSADTFGADRLMLGSDYPYFTKGMYKRSKDYISNSRLSKEDQEKVLRTNAEKLYKL